jgi:hypothetical protein
LWKDSGVKDSRELLKNYGFSPSESGEEPKIKYVYGRNYGMKDMDDSKLKNEIDDIMGRVDSIMGKIKEIYPMELEDADQNSDQDIKDNKENLDETIDSAPE